MSVTHYKTKTGDLVPLAEMNPYHLHNAIKKHERENGDADMIAALKAEQERRGGPPADAR
ncbi:MAG TPA: hypothetical protein VFB29_00255 [Pseudolabrys sp.]|nr:hypothetical protein [Pseudolabrys sp.]